jgi:hypothetical protein
VGQWCLIHARSIALAPYFASLVVVFWSTGSLSLGFERGNCQMGNKLDERHVASLIDHFEPFW